MCKCKRCGDLQYNSCAYTPKQERQTDVHYVGIIKKNRLNAVLQPLLVFALQFISRMRQIANLYSLFTGEKNGHRKKKTYAANMDVKKTDKCR